MSNDNIDDRVEGEALKTSDEGKVSDQTAGEINAGRDDTVRRLRCEMKESGRGFSMSTLGDQAESKFELVDDQTGSPRRLSRAGDEDKAEPSGPRDLEYLGDKPPEKTAEGYYKLDGASDSSVLADPAAMSRLEELRKSNPSDRTSEDNAAMRIDDQLRGVDKSHPNWQLRQDVDKWLKIINDGGGVQDADKELGKSSHTIQSLENIANTEINSGKDASAAKIAAVLHVLLSRRGEL